MFDPMNDVHRQLGKQPRRLAIVATLLAVTLLLLNTSAVLAGTLFSATLSGAAEIPGPGDPDGSGKAKLDLNQGQGQICFKITVANIDLPASAAHIHAGSATVAGPVVVTLVPPAANGVSKGCVSAAPELIKAIRQNPTDYYVNVHNAAYPAGAVRGQLSK